MEIDLQTILDRLDAQDDQIKEMEGAIRTLQINVCTYGEPSPEEIKKRMDAISS